MRNKDLSSELAERDPRAFDAVADLNLSAALCYIHQRQFAPAKEALELILRVDYCHTEAILTLCWSLIADLRLEVASLGSADDAMQESDRDNKAILTKLEIARDCLWTLHSQPGFHGLPLATSLERRELKQSACSENSNINERGHNLQTLASLDGESAGDNVSQRTRAMTADTRLTSASMD